ncbi:MAG: hypothetical protein Q9169_000980 [Polycauliona sp. 2 TL-2023]
MAAQYNGRNRVVEQQDERRSPRQEVTPRSSDTSDTSGTGSRSEEYQDKNKPNKPLTTSDQPKHIFPLSVYCMKTSYRNYAAINEPPFQLHFDDFDNQYYILDRFSHAGEGRFHVAYPGNTRDVLWTRHASSCLNVRVRTIEGGDLAVGKECTLMMKDMDDVQVLAGHMESLGMKVVEERVDEVHSEGA